MRRDQGKEAQIMQTSSATRERSGNREVRNEEALSERLG